MDTFIYTPSRILVVTLADLGDALLAVPALRVLRHTLPTAHIDVLTTPTGAKALQGLENQEPIAKHRGPSAPTRATDGLFDQLILFEKQRLDTPRSLLRPVNLLHAVRLRRRLRSGQYDACIILHHFTTWFGTLKYAALAAASGARRRYGLDNGRGFFLTDRIRDEGFGILHQAEYWLAVVGLLGAEPAASQPTFTIMPDDQHRVEEHLASLRGQIIALHPGSGAFAPARRWPIQRWAALADALIDDGLQLVLVGGPEEAELRRAMLSAMRHHDAVTDLGGRTTVSELAAVLKRCVLFVGNDSGLTHLAGSVGTPVVALFGPTDPRAWGPYGGESWRLERRFPNGVEVVASGPHRAVKAAIACSPCIYRGHQLGTPAGCPDRTCLLRIDVDQALAIMRQRLREVGKQG